MGSLLEQVSWAEFLVIIGRGSPLPAVVLSTMMAMPLTVPLSTVMAMPDHACNA